MKTPQYWKVEQPQNGTVVFRSPTTQATITVDKAAIVPYGNFNNIRSEERLEIISVLESALTLHKRFRSGDSTANWDTPLDENGKVLEQAAAADTPQVAPTASAVPAPTPALDTPAEPPAVALPDDVAVQSKPGTGATTVTRATK